MQTALEFTLLEASLSAIFSAFFGQILARAWIRVRFPFQSKIENLLILPFFMPALFVVLAILRSFGQNGLGLSIYGLPGIVLAHMLLNIPLVFYVLLQALRQVPEEIMMNARALGDVQRLVERPVLWRVLPTTTALVFLYSALSFTIVLTLGGGPSTSTIELAIYQAIRYEFDLHEAARLSVVQAGFGILILILLRRHLEPPTAISRENLSYPPARSLWLRIFLVLSLILISAFLLVPFGLVMFGGLAHMPDLLNTLRPDSFLSAFGVSLWTSFLFAVFVMIFSLLLIGCRAAGLAWIIGAISPLAISTLIMVALHPFINVFALGVPFVVAIQVLTLSPLIIRLCQLSIHNIAPEEMQLLDSLTNHWPTKLRIFYWPRLRANLMRIFSISMALAFGDLALYPLFAPAGFANIPMLIWQMLSSYQIDAAFALGAVMLCVIGVVLSIGFGIARVWGRSGDQDHA